MMTLEQLDKHIKENVLNVLGQEFGSKLKDTVGSAVEHALLPIQGDLTKRQVEQMDLIKKIQDATTGKSLLSSPRRERQKGEAFGACVRALRIAKNDIGIAAKVLKRDGHDDLSELMQEQAKMWEPDGKAMAAGDPETGGVLIPQPVTAEIIDILRSRVVVRGLGPTQIPMPAGNYRLPKKTQGTSSFYVGESQAGATSAVKTGSVLLSFKKLVTVVPASNDLFRFSSPGADGLIRDDVVDSMRVREDQAFLRDNGTSGTPKGLRQWAVDGDNALQVTSGFDLTKVTTDLGRLWLKLAGADVPFTRPAWIFAPRTFNYLRLVRTTNGPFAFGDEMARGTLLGIPFAWTTSIPINLQATGDRSEFYLVDFGDVVIGDAEGLIIDASGDASYEEGGTVKSAFHRDETVIRAITEHDLVMRREQSCTYFDNVNWV